MTLEEKFIKYVKIDTQSQEDSSLTPSSLKQFDLAKVLLEELHSYGITNAYLTKQCVIYAKIDGNPSKKKIGLIAHMDTATEIQGGNFEPRIISNYDGLDIKLNEKYTLSPKEFPSLNNHIGHSLIVTDGEHLLGGDDKAGVAIIMHIAEYYMKHPEIDHAPIRICFTPDEEVGRGPENFSVEEMDADIAYTLDGGEYDVISYETFNAYMLKVKIEGVSIHPGSAKGIMVNSLLVANEFNSMLPKDMIPSKTDGYEGFNHLCYMQGNVDNTEMMYIIRNHNNDLALNQIQEFLKIKELLSIKYPTSKIHVEYKLQYKNMKDYFINDMSAVEKISQALKSLNITPKYVPIRGGTDGATITFMGLPCPNIGDGDYNCHGRYEYVSINEMYKMYDIVKTLLEE